MSSSSTSPRIASMDQFRGYTVAGMFVVNFLSSFAVIHPLLKHNNTWFSYADSIMPSFLFAVGFSFRLTYLKRIQQAGYWSTVWTYVKRSLALVVVSLVMYGFGSEFRRWDQFSQMPPEFEPFRPKASRTHSFDELMAAAREANPGRDEQSIVALASASGASVADPRMHKKDEKSPAGRAAAVIDHEANDFVGPAVNRSQNWEALSPNARLLVHLRIALGKLLKSDLWETLAIIGATQLVVLPFIGWGFGPRFLVLIALGAAHLVLSYWFNWNFLYGENDTWLSKVWMTGNSRGWDGGFFGPICWAVAMVAGTLAYDMMIGPQSPGRAALRLIVWGVAFMVVGYGMSCLTRLYGVSGPELEAQRTEQIRQQAEKGWLGHLIQAEEARLAQRGGAGRGSRGGGEKDEIQARIQVLTDQQQAYPNLNLAESPVNPPWRRLKGRSWRELLAEPPFVAPFRDDPQHSVEDRPENYWMLGKRGPNLSFMIFATGFAFALYGLFVIVCDLGGLSVGIFRTFGTNALVAYFLHHVIGEQVEKLVPHDAKLWYCLCGFALFFLLTYACVRYLEQRKIYVKL
jgi:Heparan-alpha-glucosaminide N-acetyltransferase, catalytic